MKDRRWKRPAVKRPVEILIVLIFISFHSPVPASSFTADDNEFNGIMWGANINDVGGMKLIRDSGEIKTYKKDHETLEIPGIKTEVGYSFYQGKFFKGTILCSSSQELLPPLMKQLIKKHRGRGKQQEVSELFMEETRMYTFMWDGDPMSISYIGSDYKGKLGFRYKPIHQDANPGR